MTISYIAKILMIIGIITVLAGVLLWLAGKTGVSFGKLPGDIRITSEKGSVYFPLMTSIIVSFVLTVLVNFVIWLIKK